MIRLKNGEEIEYREDFDAFFHSMIVSVIKLSLRSASENMAENDDGNAFNNKLLREIMDNCIYITHQIQKMGSENKALQSLLITGCLFHCVVASLSKLGSFTDGNSGESGTSEKPLH